MRWNSLTLRHDANQLRADNTTQQQQIAALAQSSEALRQQVITCASATPGTEACTTPVAPPPAEVIATPAPAPTLVLEKVDPADVAAAARAAVTSLLPDDVNADVVQAMVTAAVDTCVVAGACVGPTGSPGPPGPVGPTGSPGRHPHQTRSSPSSNRSSTHAWHPVPASDRLPATTRSWQRSRSTSAAAGCTANRWTTWATHAAGWTHDRPSSAHAQAELDQAETTVNTLPGNTTLVRIAPNQAPVPDLDSEGGDSDGDPAAQARP